MNLNISIPSMDEFNALAARVAALEKKPAPTPAPAPGPAPTPAPAPQPSGIWAGWGSPIDRARFDGNTVDTGFWGLYDSVGNGGNGRRSPSAFSQGGGVLTVTGTPDNTTGGTQSNDGHAHNRGRWVVEMQVYTQGPGHPYHAVAAIIPQGVDYLGGARDCDFAEFDGNKPPYCFIHYLTPGGNKQAYAQAGGVDTTQWNEYVFTITDTWMSWHVGGKLIFVSTDPAAIPSKDIGLGFNIQLDAFQPGGMGLTFMKVRRFDYYPPPANLTRPVGPPPLVGDYR